ncbi:MAG: LarC family nickel insertion protein [Deltaproteobacteria bacterium]|nr:LarC family nickel insertion protein [Deltaproteobacteria bacterium]
MANEADNYLTNTISQQYNQLYVEAVSGAAGDMLLAALIDLGATQDPIHTAIASLAIPNLKLEISQVEITGIQACYVHSIPAGTNEHGRNLDEVLAIIARAQMTTNAHQIAKKIFTLLAHAEAASHQQDLHHVHLHEVAALDSILDVIGIAVAYDSLGCPEVTVGPIASGHGEVLCQHGRLALPVPAVKQIVHNTGIVLVDVAILGETITPTGAAALATIGTTFGASLTKTGEKIGVGAGTRRFADRPNIVRIHGYQA